MIMRKTKLKNKSGLKQTFKMYSNVFLIYELSLARQ